MLGLVGPIHFTSTNCVYVAVHTQGRTTSYDVVRRHTKSDDHVRCRTTSTHVVRPRTTSFVPAHPPSYDVVRSVTLRTSYDVVGTHDVVRRRTTTYVVARRRTTSRGEWPYDVVLASSSYLCTFSKFSGRRNRQTPPRRFWIHDVLRRRADLGEYARLVQELSLDSAGSYGYFNRAVWLCSGAGGTIHFTSTNCVYVAVHAQGRMTSYDVIQRRTTTYDVVRPGASAVVRRRTQRERPLWGVHTAYVVRRRTWSYNVIRPRTLSHDAVRRQWVNNLYDVVLASIV